MTDLLDRIAKRRAELTGGDDFAARIAKRKAELTQSTPEDVVATTPDGGRIVRTGGGLSFVSPSYSTSDPEAVARIMEGATPAEESMSGFDRQTIAANPIAARGAKFVQGVPFAGEFADEAIGAVFGDDAKQAVRASQSAMDREEPKTAAALQIAGGVAGSIPLAVAAGPSVVASAPSALGSRVATGVGLGLVAGGTEGAVSGAGRANDDSRAAGAAEGGVMGALLGAGLGATVPAIGAGVKSAWSALKGRDVSTIGKVLGISKPAAEAVRKSLDADDFAAATAALRRAGPDAMLADAGPASAQMLDTAMTYGGKALKSARVAVDARANAANARLTKVLDDLLGAPVGVKAGNKAIASRTAGVRRMAYERAYSKPINYASDAGRAIEGVIDRIPARTVRAAIDEANDAMREAGVKNAQILADIAEDGAVKFREMPNVQQLDELKQALGRIAENERDSITGRISSSGFRAQRLAADLREAIAGAVPEYKTAVKLGGDKIAEQRANDIGRKLLMPGTTREAVREVMSGASREAKAAARAGLRTYIDDTTAAVKRAISDPAMDAREAMKAIKDMSSRQARENMAEVLGEGPARGLFAALDEAGAHLELRALVARGSQTAIRQGSKEATEAIMAPGVVGQLKRGESVNAFKRTVQALTGETPEAQRDQVAAVYAEIADALTKMRGDEARTALASVQRAIEGQPMVTAEAERVARLVAGSTALGGYQIASQSTSR